MNNVNCLEVTIQLYVSHKGTALNIKNANTYKYYSVARAVDTLWPVKLIPHKGGINNTWEINNQLIGK